MGLTDFNKKVEMNTYLNISKLFGMLPYGADNEGEPNTGNGSAEGSDGKQPDNKDDKDNSDVDKGNSSQGKTDTDGAEDEDDEYKGLSAKELKRIAKDLEKKNKDHQSKIDAAEKEKEEEARKKRTKEENLEKDLNQEKENNNILRSTTAALAIENAILKEKKYTWKDVEVVQQQLNSNVVKVDDKGKVTGLLKELDRVAKEKDWMLDTGQKNGYQPPVGFQPGQGGTNLDKQHATELAEKYPELAARLR